MSDDRVELEGCRSLALAIALLATGCTGALDTVGLGETVTESTGLQKTSREQDDRIEDKRPVFDATRTVTEVFGSPRSSCEVTLNKSATVTKLDVVPFESSDDALKGKLFRGRAEAIAAAAGIPSDDTTIPSVEVVNGHLKPFNDGLYATVELALENGGGSAAARLPGKRPLFTSLLGRIKDLLVAAGAAERPALEDAAVFVGAALTLGGDAPALTDTLRARAEGQAAMFAARAAKARPIGFYTWTPELGRIFTRDRFLQGRDDGAPFGAMAAIALVLRQDPALLADYRRIAALYAGLTNPYLSYPVDALIPNVPAVAALADVAALKASFEAVHPPIKSSGWPLVAFLPASRSKEVDYFETKHPFGAPAGSTWLDVLIEAIQTGALDVAPGMDAGWYDYQLYALETLLITERAAENQHLLLTAGYKKKLIETFKSILIQNRETHAKQLGGSRAVSAPPVVVDIYPQVPVEPLATVYLRTARGYRFLRTFLQATLGSEFLDGSTRLRESGDRETSTLVQELDSRVALLYGLYFLSADAVGMARETALLADELTAINAKTSIAAARSWLDNWTADRDVMRDTRVIVPIAEERGFTSYWAVIGVKALKMKAEFVAGHEPKVVNTLGCTIGKVLPHTYTLLVEETAEVRLPSSRPPPTRAELRRICDGQDNKDAIIRALEAP